jgi:Na+(H+)/acetate symporter ActP
VLPKPEKDGLPYVITGMVDAGGMAAAMSTADGLILAIANAISHGQIQSQKNYRVSLVYRLRL